MWYQQLKSGEKYTKQQGPVQKFLQRSGRFIAKLNLENQTAGMLKT